MKTEFNYAMLPVLKCRIVTEPALKDLSLSSLPKITSSMDAVNIFRPFFSDIMYDKERFVAMFLNRNSRILSVLILSDGGTSGTVVDTMQLFKAAVLNSASALICCHNHPSGNLKPSEHDHLITKRIREAGKNLEINLLDHVIITPEGHYSFADEGYL